MQHCGAREYKIARIACVAQSIVCLSLIAIMAMVITTPYNVYAGNSSDKVMVASEGKPQKIAILEFYNVNAPTQKDNKGRIFSEIFTTYSAENTCLQLVERHLIQKIFDEMEFGQHEVQGSDAQKIGAILESNVILTGTVSEILGKLRVDARLIHVESGRILQAAGGTCSVDLESMTVLVKEMSLKLFKEFQANCDKAKQSSATANELVASLKRLTRLTPEQVIIGVNKESFKLGEKMILSFTANNGGYLTVFNYTPGDDCVVILFPNKFNQNNKVTKGQKITIPSKKDNFELTAQPPVGESLVVALLTENKLDMASKWDGANIFSTLKSQGTRAFAVDVKNKNRSLGSGELRVKITH